MKTKMLFILLLVCCLSPALTLADQDPLHCPDLSNSKNIGNWTQLLGEPSGHDSFTVISIPLIHLVGCTYNNGNLVLGKNYPAAVVKPDDPNHIWQGLVCSQAPSTCLYKLTYPGK
ncbi:MAG: hypothetical protein ABIH77_06210 [Pseudomonadota bacterium]|nr:hypothetical protein [Gammaproteobacteria bacterium]MBU1558356.1 hypothetical protein [Gammaproteobacteria bacterium]MBU1628724.1 hypothetical protein [Gammaproteobacteria bacterium]MBU1927180.1 hypothetical protein [Gammaproteobacteria bacterium]MBU2546389.1 hypothetical protein [Gammaproteobacteria bacterium]